MFESNKLYDKEFRQQLKANPKQALATLNQMNQDYEYVVLCNTKTTIHFVFPSQSILESDLLQTQAAANVNNVGTASTSGSVGSAGCLTSTISSPSSAGSLGTAGSINFDIKT